jgi:uncharacterized phosphosugar-binding protein
VVKGLEGRIGEITAVADAAAARLIGGGRLFLAGERGMVAELHVRAGGLCGARMLHPGKSLVGKGDVVLFSDYDGAAVGRPDGAWPTVVGTGALVVLAASREHPVCTKPPRENVRPLPVEMPLDSRLARLPSGERVVRGCAPALAIAQWAFTAELIGACRRKGRQLAVYLSIHLDEGRKRFERTRGLLFESELRPQAAAPGAFARTFLGHVRRALEAVRNEESVKIRQAAAWIRQAKAAGRKACRHLTGHLPPSEAGASGDPPCFTQTVRGPLGPKGAERIPGLLGKGDVYLLVGYQQNQDAMAAAANRLGARSVFIISRGPGEAQARSPLHLYINPQWPLTDGCLDLAGYDVRACPLSAILGLVCYHAICAEAVAARP